MTEAMMRLAGDSDKPLPKRINFTDARARDLQCPAGKRQPFVYDEKIRGLALRLTTGGRKHWYVYKWHNGKPIKVRLGVWPEVNVDTARDLAVAKLAEFADGVNPNVAKKEARAKEATFGALFDHYMSAHAKVHKRERSWRDDQDNYRRHLEAPLGKKELTSIDRPTIQRLHIRIGENNGHYIANRLVALIRKMFNIASDIGFTGQNPTKGIRLFKEESRERYLSADELQRFFEALKDEPDQMIKDFFEVLLLTGARKGNVLSMAWADINMDTATWTIPAAASKNGRPMAIPLVPRAIEILKTRQKGKSGFVFASYGRTGHFKDPRAAWVALLERAQITDLHIHDLRRTLGSWAAGLGVSLPIIGRALGHKSASATQVYSRVDLTPVRAAVESTALAMLAASKPKKKKPKA